MIDKKIIFMGTPDIAAQHLSILIENKLNLVGVFTQPVSYTHLTLPTKA